MIIKPIEIIEPKYNILYCPRCDWYLYYYENGDRMCYKCKKKMSIENNTFDIPIELVQFFEPVNYIGISKKYINKGDIVFKEDIFWDENSKENDNG
jgi:hypothetical protein